jgi:hypothetical protein
MISKFADIHEEESLRHHSCEQDSDPRRAAILLLGGDKTGNDRWYDEHVPIADKLYDEYLRELEREGLT